MVSTDGSAPVLAAPTEVARPSATTRLVISGVQGPSPCGRVLVKKGDRVIAGQMLFGPESWAEETAVVPVHSPVSGKVADLQPVCTPGGEITTAVTVEADGLGERAEPLARLWDPLHPDQWPPEELRRFMRMAGVDGTPCPGGGDLYERLARGLADGVVVINAVGCEPGLPSDMFEAAANPEALLIGAVALSRAGGADRALVVVQRGSPADAALTGVFDEAGGQGQLLAGVGLVRLPDVDWMWVPVLLAREAVARSGLGKKGAAGRLRGMPLLVESAATAVAVGTALLEGRPVTERLVTVSTPGRIRAVRVPIGTPVSALLDGALGADGDACRLLLLAGGPLQGSPLPDTQVPVTKAISAITAMRQKVSFRPEAPCIRCGRCAQVCPAGLLPLYIARAASAAQMDEARAMGASECVECAACAVVCPSYRPLLQWIRLAKYGRARRPARGGVV